MAVRKHTGRRVAFSLFLLLLLGLLLSLAANPGFFLHALLFGPEPLTWERALEGLADYGYWIFIGYAILTGAALFLENRNPDRTLAWLLVLGLLPVLGLILYWVVGPNFRYLADKRRFRLSKPRRHDAFHTEAESSPLVTDLANLVYHSAGARLASADEARLLYDGEEAFGLIKASLAGATRSILLESYIIKNDGLGREIRDILVERARAGVLVCVIYDAVGSWRMGSGYLSSLRAGGVHAYPFLPVSFPMFRGANYRNHRKIIVVDTDTAFMGGMNIGDEYLGKDPKMGYWRDAHLMLHGPAAGTLRRIFLRDLAVCGASRSLRRKLRSMLLRPGNVPAAPSAAPPAKDAGTPLQIVTSGPDTPWDTIQKAYFSLISRARKRVWLTTPYLVPGNTLMEALCMAALTGVDVRVLIPEKADHRLVHWASLNCCEELLRAGVRVFLYRPDRFIHSKTITSDGAVMSIGSANFDTRSLNINFEVQAFIYDGALAGQGEAAFLRDTADSRELVLSAWRHRSVLQRIKENTGKLISSLA